MPFSVDFQSISGPSLLIGLVMTAAIVVLIADWRVALLGLILQYGLLGILLTRFVDPSVALVRVFSGGLASAILYISMHHRATVEQERHSASNEEDAGRPVIPRQDDIFIVGFSFRLFAAALVVVAIIGMASSMTFLGLPSYVLFGSLWLMSIGILVAMLARDALRLGLGILVFSGGFCILDTAIEGSLFLFGLINISDLLIALVVAHLATLPSEFSEGRRRRDPP